MKKILSIMLYTSMAITASSAEMRLTFQSAPEFRFEEGGNTLEICYIPTSQEVKAYTLLDSSVNLLKSEENYYEIKGISSNIETLNLDIEGDINVKLSCDIDNLKVKGKAISLGGERRFKSVESESLFFEISTDRPVYVDDKCWCHPSGFVKFKDDLDMQVNTADLAERKEMLTKRANMEQYQEDLYSQILGEKDISEALQQWKGGLTKKGNDYDVNDFLTQLNSLAGELLGDIECTLCKSFMDSVRKTLQNENTVTWKQIADIVDALCKAYKDMSDIEEKANASNYTVEEINQLKGKHIQLTQSVSQLDEFIKQRQDKTYDFTTMAGSTINVTSNQILKTIAKTHNTEEINTIKGIIAGAKDNELIDIVQQTNANRKPNPTEYNMLIIPNQITTIKQMIQTLETEMMHYTPKQNIDKDKEIALLQTEIERLKKEVDGAKNRKFVYTVDPKIKDICYKFYHTQTIKAGVNPKKTDAAYIMQPAVQTAIYKTINQNTTLLQISIQITRDMIAKGYLKETDPLSWPNIAKAYFLAKKTNLKHSDRLKQIICNLQKNYTEFLTFITTPIKNIEIKGLK